MPVDRDNSNRKQLGAVIALILERRQFRKREIQFLCGEAQPRFVQETLKQLVSDGFLYKMPQGEDDYFTWSEESESFDASTWIEQQLHGNQVRDLPQQERPRERLTLHGPQDLATSELLAILIRVGTKKESAIVAGQKIANHFANRIERLADCSPSELKNITSVAGETAYCQIMAGIELGRRVATALEARQPAAKINSTASAIEFCSKHFSRLACDGVQEEFHIVTLDTKLQVIQSHRITVGTLDASLVHPREVFRAAIRDSASAILLVHNHPSGDPTPSRQDRDVTERLKKAGELIGINVIDHVIVARSHCLSLAEDG